MKKIMSYVLGIAGTLLLVAIGFGVLANIGPIIGIIIVLCLVPVLFEIIGTVFGICAMLVMWLFVTVWEWWSPTR